ncbi:MAG TPA: mechanosensitive ion channel domain-containing protein [Gemmatimonadales bacterium]|nr:mechanosensitive ion channel domain-containing protein [Gemmatimonadales bacterium]
MVQTGWLETTFGVSAATQNKIAATAVVVLAVVIIRRVILSVVWNRTHDARLRYRWQKGIAYVTSPLAILVIGRIWFAGFQSVATFLGLVSAGIAISLKDILVNLAGWIFIVWRRPFNVGDRIQVGTHAGDVIDVRLFQFTLNEIGNWVQADQSTGRILHIPNGKVLTDVIANYSEGFEFIWNEIPVVVTFESNWEKAKQILLDIVTRDSADIVKAAEDSVRETTRKFMIFYTNLTPTVYTALGESGIMLTMRYLVQPRKRRVTEEKIWEDILRAFVQHDDIDLAYVTRRNFNNPTEGKPGTGGIQSPARASFKGSSD